MTLKLLFDPEDGRVLGAQAVGGAGVDKRIDVLAVAIQAGMTVFDLEEMELCYAPQFGSAKDPINMAGFVAGGLLRGDHSQVDAEAPITPVAHHTVETTTETIRHVIPTPCAERQIDLPTALALAGTSNPTIALAREAIVGSRADLLRANVMLLPTIHAGADFNLHRGHLESSRGQILDVNRQSAYVGAGAAVVGAGTVGVPGVRVVGHLTEAMFEPVAARQRVAESSFDAQATNNSILRDVAVQVFALQGAEARLRVLRQSKADLNVIVELTASFVRAGQGRDSDANRAASEARLLRAITEQAEEEVAVAAAELARLLSLDPTTELHCGDEPICPIELVDARECLESLVQLAISRRPEIGARSAAVAAFDAHLREEQWRPFVPLLSVGYSAGGFGGGSDLFSTRFGPLSGRGDFDAFAVWSLSNLGLGNAANQRQRRAEVGQAEADRLAMVNIVRREVAEALGEVAAHLREIEIASRQLKTAEEGYRLDLIRSKNLEGRPIEVLNSVNLLVAARQELIRVIVGYNQAQVRLFVALGQPPILPDASSNP